MVRRRERRGAGVMMCSGGGLPATSGTCSVGSHRGGREDTLLSWRVFLCGPPPPLFGTSNRGGGISFGAINIYDLLYNFNQT